MIKLEKLKQEYVAKHVAMMEPEILKRLKKLEAGHRDYPDLASLLCFKRLLRHLRANVNNLLVGDAAQLRLKIAEFAKLFPGVDSSMALAPSARSRLQNQLAAALSWAFPYERLRDTKGEWGAYELVKAHRLRICAYCHTSHLNYHDDEHGLTMRPPLDHFFPRSRYPFLGVSVHNLVPSCHQCNSSVKRSENPIDVNLLHPYEFDESKVTFCLEAPAGTLRPAWHPDATIAIAASGAEALEFVRFFRLHERYGWYGPELEDLRGRVKELGDANGKMAGLLAGHEFVYGFSKPKSRERMLGRCIVDVAQQLMLSYSP